MSRKVSIKDIAKATGFSVTTVSYALRHHPKISKPTRDLVCAKAGELGYRTDPTMREFMAYIREGRERPVAHALGFLNISTPGRYAADCARSATIYQTMSDRARELGYHLNEIQMKDWKQEGGSLNRILETRGIRGIILSTFDQDFRMPKLDWSRLTALSFDAAPIDCPMHTVGHSHFRGMLLALEEMEKLGYRRIGLAVSNPHGNLQRDQWLAAYLLRVRQSSQLEIVPIYDGGKPDGRAAGKAIHTPKAGKRLEEKSFLQWINEHGPEAVLSNEFDVKHWLEHAGFKIPGDIGFALLHCDVAEKSNCSGVDQLTASIARIAVESLVSHLEQNQTGQPDEPIFIRINGKWRAGDSLRCLL